MLNKLAFKRTTPLSPLRPSLMLIASQFSIHIPVTPRKCRRLSFKSQPASATVFYFSAGNTYKTHDKECHVRYSHDKKPRPLM